MNLLVAHVLTPHFGIPPPDDLARRWRALSGEKSLTVRRDSRGLVCEAGAMRVLVAPARGPIPNGEAEAHFTFSAAHYFGYDEPEAHAAHVNVASGFADAPTLADLELHLALVAALLTELDGVGTYDGSATHRAAFVLETFEQQLPKTALWCGVSYAKAKQRPGVVSLMSDAFRESA